MGKHFCSFPYKENKVKIVRIFFLRVFRNVFIPFFLISSIFYCLIDFYKPMNKILYFLMQYIDNQNYLNSKEEVAFKIDKMYCKKW